MQFMSRNVARDINSADPPDLHLGTRPLEALKVIIFVAADQKQTLSVMHVDASRAYILAKVHRFAQQTALSSTK